jgi:Arc/MetJ-type ribon-helix-helix transcriptional regulator
MTARPEIAVSLPADLVDAARAAVDAGRAASVSAYVAGALREHVERDALDALLADMLGKTGGPLTDAERAALDREAGWQ